MSYLGQHFFIQCLQQDIVNILKGSPGDLQANLREVQLLGGHTEIKRNKENSFLKIFKKSPWDSVKQSGRRRNCDAADIE